MRADRPEPSGQTGAPPGAPRRADALQINCHLPIRLRVLGQPSDGQLEQLGQVLARNLARARDVLAAHGRQGAEVFQPIELRWMATAATGISPALRQGIEGVVRRGLAKPVLPAGRPAPPAKPVKPAKPIVRRGAAVKRKTADVPWRVRIEARFHITPRRFLEIREKFRESPDEIDPLELYYPLLDTRRPAVAWVIEILREYEFRTLGHEVTLRFAARRSKEEFIWSISGWGIVRQLLADADQDRVLVHRIPDFGPRGFTEARPATGDAGPQTILRPGAWIITGFLPLPLMRLTDFIEIGERQSTDLALRDVAGLVTPEDFAAELHLKWAEVEQAAPDAKVAVLVEPFTVRRKVHERTLASLFQQRRWEQFKIRRLGRIVLRADHALRELPPFVQAFLASLPEEGFPGPARGVDAGFWQAGSRGVSLALRFPDDLADRALLGLHGSFLVAQAAEVERILGLENTVWNANRTQALAVFIGRWRDGDPRLFALLLDLLARRGTLDAFIGMVRGLRSLDPHLRRIVVALAVKTRYAQDPRILALARQMEEFARSLETFHYDVDAQEVWIDGDGAKRLQAAGESFDDERGVVAEVSPNYSQSARVHYPRPEVIERLREPTWKKVGALMARTICVPGESRTQEQLLHKAAQEAAEELNLEEKDFVKVTLRLSLRVLKLERQPQGGLETTYVHYQEVRKIGDEPWQPYGELRIASPIAFEAALRSYLVEHLMSAVTVLLLAGTAVLGGMLIIVLGIATVGELIVLIAINVLLYRLSNTDPEDRTYEGYFLSALLGELDVVGFRLLSGVVPSIMKGSGWLAGKLIPRQLVIEAAKKWIASLLRGGLMASGVGGLAVTNLLAEDLLTYSYCEGWSSPAKYWDRWYAGFKAGLLFEFVAIPLLAPPLRRALEKVGSVREAAGELRATGLSEWQIARLILRGADEVALALGRTIKRPDVVEGMTRGFRQWADELLEAVGRSYAAVGREYASRAYQALLEAYGLQLGPAAARGLRRLLEKASHGEIDRALQRLLALRASGLKMAEPSDLFRVLGALDDKLLTHLVQTGQLTELFTSPRLLALLTRDLAKGARLLAGPFQSTAGELERYLGRLEELPPPARESIVGALLQDHPLSPNILLGVARQVGVLDDPTLTLLRRLQATTNQQGIEHLLQRLAQQRAPVSDLFRALGGVDDAILGRLVRTGQLPELASSPRLLALLAQEPAAASKLLAGSFQSSEGRFELGKFERYLGNLEDLRTATGAVDPAARMRLLEQIPTVQAANAAEVEVLASRTLGVPREQIRARLVGGGPGQQGATGARVYEIFHTPPGGQETMVSAVKIFPNTPSQAEEFAGELSGLRRLNQETIAKQGAVSALGVGKTTAGEGVLVMTAARGQSIDSLILALGRGEISIDVVRAACRRNGEALARLHTATARATPASTAAIEELTRNFGGTFAELATAVARSTNPAVRGLNMTAARAQVNPLIAGLERNPGASAVVHGDFHPGNVFYDQASGQITFIDASRVHHSIDRTGAAILSPARDVASFESALEVFASKPAYGVDRAAREQLQRAFREGYASAVAENGFTREALAFHRARYVTARLKDALTSPEQAGRLEGALREFRAAFGLE